MIYLTNKQNYICLFNFLISYRNNNFTDKGLYDLGNSIYKLQALNKLLLNFSQSNKLKFFDLFILITNNSSLQ